MKKIAFVFARAGLFFAIDNLTFINLNRAIRSMENGDYCKVYIALNHLDNKERMRAENYIQKNFINNMTKAMSCNIFVSESAGEYEVKFLEYLKLFPNKEIYVNVFANIYYKDAIRVELENARELMTEKDYCHSRSADFVSDVPLLFM